MKSALAVAAAAAALGAAILLAPAARAAEVGVSIHVGQPGLYGRIDIGRVPAPTVWTSRPIVVVPGPVIVARPVHLWVPPGHRRDWRRHCGRYDACGAPVYFVTDEWARAYVARDWRGDDRDDDDRGRGRAHGKGRG
jgi:hypothetical protein